MTTKEFLKKNGLDMSDIGYIEDLLTLRYSYEKIAEMMELDAEELREFWEGE